MAEPSEPLATRHSPSKESSKALRTVPARRGGCHTPPVVGRQVEPPSLTKTYSDVDLAVCVDSGAEDAGSSGWSASAGFPQMTVQPSAPCSTSNRRPDHVMLTRSSSGMSAIRTAEFESLFDPTALEHSMFKIHGTLLCHRAYFPSERRSSVLGLRCWRTRRSGAVQSCECGAGDAVGQCWTSTLSIDPW